MIQTVLFAQPAWDPVISEPDPQHVFHTGIYLLMASIGLVAVIIAARIWRNRAKSAEHNALNQERRVAFVAALALLAWVLSSIAVVAELRGLSSGLEAVKMTSATVERGTIDATIAFAEILAAFSLFMSVVYGIVRWVSVRSRSDPAQHFTPNLR